MRLEFEIHTGRVALAQFLSPLKIPLCSQITQPPATYQAAPMIFSECNQHRVTQR